MISGGAPNAEHLLSSPPYLMLFPHQHFVWLYHGSLAPQRRSWTEQSTSSGPAPQYIYHIFPLEEACDPPASSFDSITRHLVDVNLHRLEIAHEVIRDAREQVDSHPSGPLDRIPVKPHPYCHTLGSTSAYHASAELTPSFANTNSSVASSPAALPPGTPTRGGHPSGRGEPLTPSTIQGSRIRPFDDLDLANTEAEIPADERHTRGRKRRRRRNELPRDFERRHYGCHECGKFFAR